MDSSRLEAAETRVEIDLEVLTPSGAREPIHLTHGAVVPWPLDVLFPDGIRKQYRERTLWHNVLRLREDLEATGKHLLCAASRPNTTVSAMMLDMLGGSSVYQVTLGERARLESRVHLFQPAAPEEVATVAQQADFTSQWAASVKRIGD